MYNLFLEIFASAIQKGQGIDENALLRKRRKRLKICPEK